jgi:DNA-binding Lrp family transcriptional regulator
MADRSVTVRLKVQDDFSTSVDRYNQKMTQAELARRMGVQQQFIAKIEGRPKVRGRDIALELGVSHTSAWRLLTRLEGMGALRFETLVRRDLSGDCECVVYLKTVLSDRAAIDAFEGMLAADVVVRSIARVAGKDNYRIHAIHRSTQAANAWYRTLLEHPSVCGGTLSFVRTLFDRLTFAAALLGS